MMKSFATARYVGLPFVRRKDGRPGFECWDLIRRVYSDVVNIELPEYGEISAEQLNKVADAFDEGMASETWVSAITPQALDVLVMLARDKGLGRRHRHVGVMVDEYRVLHLEANTDSVVVPITHGSVKFRLAGFFRHKALA